MRPNEFTIEDVFDLVFRAESGGNGVMCMVYECYLDDSKDGKQEFTYVCAGFYGKKNDWIKFEADWKKQLDAEGIDYYKTSEFKSLTKQFERYKLMPEPLGREGARQVRDRLEKIIIGSPGIHGVGVVVPVGEYEAVLKHHSAEQVFPREYIYHRAFEMAILKAARLSCTPKDSIAFVHDDGQDFVKLHTLYMSFKEKNPKIGAVMKGFLPLDDKDYGALQAADMFSNSIQGTTVKFIKENVDANSSNIFMFDRSNISVWTREFGEKVLAHNMGSRQLPIPESLAQATAAE